VRWCILSALNLSTFVTYCWWAASRSAPSEILGHKKTFKLFRAHFQAQADGLEGDAELSTVPLSIELDPEPPLREEKPRVF
jgi:hypothetical protein